MPRLTGSAATLQPLVAARVDIRRVIQDESVWCWAACAEMALSRWGVVVPQCGVVHRWLLHRHDPACSKCCHDKCARRLCPHKAGQDAACIRLLRNADRTIGDLYQLWQATATATTDPGPEILNKVPVVVGVTRKGGAHMRVAMAVLSDGTVGYLDPQNTSTKDPTALAAGVSLCRSWPLPGRCHAWKIEGQGADQC